MNFAKLVSCVRRLIAAGYPESRAVLVVYRTWALTPEQLSELGAQLASRAA